ncbi:hypothetical protein PQX77_012838 [Marasmius sp. AFHP31]|nr:hypothetical protein PQX77_012838 [Marasmius sp. AFHP31]
MSSLFQASGDIFIEGNQHFQQAGGNIHNYYVQGGGSLIHPGRDRKSLLPIQDEFREIRRGDIALLDEIYTRDTKMAIEHLIKSTNPFRKSVVAVRTVSIRETAYTAKIVSFGDRLFTVVVFEPENKEDEDSVKLLWNRVYRAYSDHMSPLFTQLFGLGRLSSPTFIMHDELANADYPDQYSGSSIITFYFMYTATTSAESLRAARALKALSIPILGWNSNSRTNAWMFNLNTRSWQYDLASASISGLSGEEDNHYLPQDPPKIPLRGRPQLNTHDIITCVERNFGDFLYLITTMEGIKVQMWWFERRGLLTFGTVVHRHASDVLAHLASTPSPQWYCESNRSIIHANISSFVPSRVNLSFHATGKIPGCLHFTLRFPKDQESRLRAAYLSQSLNTLPYLGHKIEHLKSFDSRNPRNNLGKCMTIISFSPIDVPLLYLVFIDKIGLVIVGDFLNDPETYPTPVFLFVPPIPVEHINDVYCVRYPLPDTLFYWSLDPNGKTVIPEEEWEKHGIPKLRAATYVGSLWGNNAYRCIREHLNAKGYELDGKRYAQDYGYPELIRGDPHDIRMVEVEDPESTPPSTADSSKAENVDLNVEDSRT